MEKYDEFFLLLRKEIVPLLKQIKELTLKLENNNYKRSNRV